MLTFEKARQLVAEQICQQPDWLPPADKLIIVDSATIERTWGWIFFYTSKLWVETENIHYALAGNSPVLVERKSGRLIPTGTAHPIEHYISNYERTGDPNG